jgi:hypothetical protein
MKLTRAILAAQPVSQYHAGEAVPGLIVANYGPVLKPIGSVSMLPRKLGGAVDADLMVYGTGNVRVVGTFRTFLVMRRPE